MKRRTGWGVDLERAIVARAAQRGERIRLEHGGSEAVRLPDGTTAEQNTWHVRGASELAKSVLNPPGSTMVSRTPIRSISRARAAEKSSTPHLAAE